MRLEWWGWRAVDAGYVKEVVLTKYNLKDVENAVLSVDSQASS